MRCALRRLASVEPAKRAALSSAPSALIAANVKSLILFLRRSCGRETQPSSRRRSRRCAAPRLPRPETSTPRPFAAAALLAMASKVFPPVEPPEPGDAAGLHLYKCGGDSAKIAPVRAAPARRARRPTARAPHPQGPPGPRVRDRRRGGQNYAGAAARVLHQGGRQPPGELQGPARGAVEEDPHAQLRRARPAETRAPRACRPSARPRRAPPHPPPTLRAPRAAAARTHRRRAAPSSQSSKFM